MTEIGLQNIQYCNILNAFGIIMELEIYVKKTMKVVEQVLSLAAI